MIRVVLADANSIVRKGVRLILQAESDIEIVDEAANGQEALDKACELLPDLLIIDVSMPVLNGVEVIRRVHGQHIDVKVLVLTAQDDPRYLDDALASGAAGYALQTVTPSELVNAVRTVYSGEVFLHSSLVRHLVHAYVQGDRSLPPPRPAQSLTPRERQVLKLLADGCTAREIAKRLTISIKTVDHYKESLMEKFRAHNRVQLVRHAIRDGLVDEENEVAVLAAHNQHLGAWG